jgi:hypothetical protein
MKFQAGDKVSFINEKQDGIVTFVSAGGRVTVRIEDGFEIEVLERELVKTGSVSQKNTLPQEKVAEKIQEEPFTADELAGQGTIAFISVPAAIGAVLSGPVQFYLVNKSEFDALYTCYLNTGKNSRGINAGVIEKGSSIQVFTSGRNELFDSGPFHIEMLLYSKNGRPQAGYIRKEIAVSLPDLENVGARLSGRSAFGKATVLFDGSQPEDIPVKDLLEKWGEHKTKEPKPAKPVKNSGHSFFVNEKTVDLHIEELVDDFTGMSNPEILSIQLNKFNEEMHEGIRNHFKRIIFIHGVGKGVLKQSILNELKNYKGVKAREADPFKYGQGATEVLF